MINKAVRNRGREREGEGLEERGEDEKIQF